MRRENPGRAYAKKLKKKIAEDYTPPPTKKPMKKRGERDLDRGGDGWKRRDAHGLKLGGNLMGREGVKKGGTGDTENDIMTQQSEKEGNRVRPLHLRRQVEKRAGRGFVRH